MITSGTDFGLDCAPDRYRTVDPMGLLADWIPAAGPPPLMALATVGRDGGPDVRHVLLTECDRTAIYFHTDARSTKVAQLQRVSRAAVSVAWPQAGRQVSIRGGVEVAAADEQRRAYRNRPRYLQLLAWLNDPTSAALPVADRRARWAAFDAAHPDLDLPADWIGFALHPTEIDFWRGDPDGPSQRTRFTRTDDDSITWTTEVLPG